MRPDYLMNLDGEEIRRLFPENALNETHNQYLQDKRWWPVESKATKRIGSEDSKIKALSQLISFWVKEKDASGDFAVGCGLIVTFYYEDTEDVHRHYELLISLILPLEMPVLINRLSAPQLNSNIKSERDGASIDTFRYFHGCNNQ